MQALFTVVAGKVDTFRDFWIRLIDGFTGFGTHDFDQITACRGKMISDADQYLAAGCQRQILPRRAGLYGRGDDSFSLLLSCDPAVPHQGITQGGILHTVYGLPTPGPVGRQVRIRIRSVYEGCR